MQVLTLKIVERRIKRLEERLKKYKTPEGVRDEDYWTYHGGHSIGYIQGQLNVLYDMKEDLEEE